MPVKIIYTEDGLGVRYAAKGITTGEEVIQANKETINDERFPSLKYKIADRSECDEYLVDGASVKIIAEQEREASQINPDLKVALIAGSEVQFGMSRMYQSLMAGMGFECDIFEDHEAAIEWINKKIQKSE